MAGYRQDLTAFVVGRLVDRLEQRLGPDRLFPDLDSIPSGLARSGGRARTDPVPDVHPAGLPFDGCVYDLTL